MTLLYSVCALIGGSVLVVQFLMTLLGFHGHHDLPDDVSGDFGGDHFGHDGTVDVHGHADSADHDAHGSTWLFSVITFRTLVAATTFFGLTGLATTAADVSPLSSLTLALGVGLAAMLGVHWAMQQLFRLRTDGTVRLERAVGHVGTVYVRIPGQRRGAGKIQLGLQNRTVELEAWTAGDDIPTGARIVVTQLSGAETVEVERAPPPLPPPPSHEVSHV